MSEEDKEYVQITVNNEGFDYAFYGYSNYNKIEDEKFHELRNKYLDARQELEKYINRK